MKPIRHSILVAIVALAVQDPASLLARTINWGGAVDDVNVQSDGSPVTATFNFEIGTFGSFTPDETNTSLWAANWQVLDVAVYNETLNFFTATFDIEGHPSLPGQVVSSSAASDPTDVFLPGDQVYLWIYNVDLPGPGAEWTLATNDGGGAGDWLLPGSGNQTADPLDWRVSTASTIIFGGLNNVTGPGERSGGPGAFALQTHTFVPEPSSLLLLMVAGGALLFGRGRRRSYQKRP